MNEDFIVITSAIDNSLEFVARHLRGFIHTVYHVPEYMVDDTKQTSTDEWCHWMPLKANLSEVDFENYEKQTGIKLPTSYKAFLGYKYFIELNFGHEVNFFRHTKNWIGDNLGCINQWGQEYTIAKGLLPFANYTDWGLVCFDSKGVYDNNEYNIVYITH